MSLRHVRDVLRGARKGPWDDVDTVMLRLTPETRALLERAVTKQRGKGRLDYDLGDAAADVLAWVVRTEAQMRPRTS